MSQGVSNGNAKPHKLKLLGSTPSPAPKIIERGSIPTPAPKSWVRQVKGVDGELWKVTSVLASKLGNLSAEPKQHLPRSNYG